MDFNLSSEQESLRDSVQRVIADRYTFAVRERVVAEGGFDRALWKQFADLGWLGLGVDEAQGGFGGTPEDRAIMVGELARGLVVEPVVPVLKAARMLAGCACEAAGSLAASLVEGSVIVPALLESGSRFEGVSPASRVLGNGGNVKVSGRKTLVYGAPVADVFIVSAVNSDGKLSLIAVKPGAGVSVRSYQTISGTAVGDVDFNDANGLLLVQGATAANVIADAIDDAAVMTAAAALGTAEAAIVLARDHISQRRQFGTTLSSFQVVQHLLADMYVDAQTGQGYLHYGLAGLRLTDPSARARAVSAAKYGACAAARRVAGHGIQLHGAMGMAMEHAAGHHYRHAVELEQRWGSGTFHLQRYGALRTDSDTISLMG